MSIKYNFEISGGNLPKALPVDQRLLALPDLTDWWEMDDRSVTQVGGAVSDIKSRVGGGTDFTQASVGNRAALIGDAINGFPALDFDGTNYYTANLADPEAAFTWAIIYKGAQADEVLFGSRVDASNQTGFRTRVADSDAAFSHGSAAIVAPQRVGEWNLAVMGHDTSTAMLSMNGAPYVSQSTDNAGGGSTIVLGAMNGGLSLPFTGQIADIIVLSGAPTDNVDAVDLIKQHAAHTYSIAIG